MHTKPQQANAKRLLHKHASTGITSIKFYAVLLLLYLLVCNRTFAQKAWAPAKKEKVIYGVASFYSKSLEGTLTATGEVFHHNQLIAASNHFKLNAWVRVTNLKNGKSIIVRINDRMGKSMQSLGRVLDVTRLAAEKLNFLHRGLARVKVEEIIK